MLQMATVSSLPESPSGPIPIAWTEPRIEWLDRSADAEWDAFVKQSPLGLVYHLSAWRRVLTEAFPHIDGRFLVLRSRVGGEIVAGLPVYTVKSWLLGNHVSSLPYATFCDPLIESAEQFGVLLRELEPIRWRDRNRFIEIRSTKTSGLLTQLPLIARSNYKHHYLRLNRSAEALFATFAKSSVRQKATKASRDGVIVEEQEGKSALRACYAILSDTRARLSLPVLPFRFFEAMRRHLAPGQLKLLVALQQGKPVACHLILRFKGTWISEHSGSNDEANSGVNQLLYWETIKRAIEDGAKIFSFGRTSATNEGLLSYKRRWSPIEEDLFDFTLSGERQNVADSLKAREHSASYRMVRFILARAPRPLYRAIGAYCYRHVG
jgi:CelD/BcsL family acetyltransferase involved in cellulose biosynthesis